MRLGLSGGSVLWALAITSTAFADTCYLGCGDVLDKPIYRTSNVSNGTELSTIGPLLARIYPNGKADVNHFHAAGGMGFLIGQLLDAGLLHGDVTTVAGAGGLARYRQEPYLHDGVLAWREAPSASLDASVLAPIDAPFSADGGLKLLTGNLGRAIIKTSAVKSEHRRVEAPAIVFDNQDEVIAAFDRGELRQNFAAVVRYQGPRANGMPELHKLTPLLSVLQDQGFHVALVTDGRMSGASGKVPAAIHVTPECFMGGPLARVRTGDTIIVDANNGTLEAHVAEAGWQARTPELVDLSSNHYGLGRELFAGFRANVVGAEQGAMSFLSPESGGTRWSLHAPAVQDTFAFTEEDSSVDRREGV